jgi:hypothetical protein
LCRRFDRILNDWFWLWLDRFGKRRIKKSYELVNALDNFQTLHVPSKDPEDKPDLGKDPDPKPEIPSIWDNIWKYAKILDSRLLWFLIGLIPGGAAIRPVVEMVLEVLEKLAQMFVATVAFATLYSIVFALRLIA